MLIPQQINGTVQKLQHPVAALNALGMVLNVTPCDVSPRQIDRIQEVLNGIPIFNLELIAHLLYGKLQAPHHIPIFFQQLPCIMIQRFLNNKHFVSFSHSKSPLYFIMMDYVLVKIICSHQLYLMETYSKQLVDIMSTSDSKTSLSISTSAYIKTEVISSFATPILYLSNTLQYFLSANLWTLCPQVTEKPFIHIRIYAHKMEAAISFTAPILYLPNILQYFLSANLWTLCPQVTASLTSGSSPSPPLHSATLLHAYHN